MFETHNVCGQPITRNHFIMVLQFQVSFYGFSWFQVGVLWFSWFQVNSFLVPGRFLWFSRLQVACSWFLVGCYGFSLFSVRCFMVPGWFSWFQTVPDCFFFMVPGRILWFSRFQVDCYGFHGSSSVFQDSMLVFIGFGLS